MGAELAPGASLDVFPTFGGVDVFVPQGWRVNIRGIPLFGGSRTSARRGSCPPDAPVLDLSAVILFGGVEVKH